MDAYTPADMAAFNAWLVWLLVLVATANSSLGAQVQALSSSSIEACLNPTQPLIPGITCADTTRLSISLWDVKLNADPPNAQPAQLLTYDLNDGRPGGVFAEQVTVTITVARGQVFDFPLTLVGFTPYSYFGYVQTLTCRTPTLATSCLGGDLLDAGTCPNPLPSSCDPPQPGQGCALSNSDRDTKITARYAEFMEHDTLAYPVPTVVMVDPIAGILLGANCGGGSGCDVSGGNKMIQNYWIGPTYRVFTSGQLGSTLFYQIDVTVTKASDLGNPITLSLTPTSPPLGISGVGSIGVKLITISNPGFTTPPSFTGVFVVPKDQPYSNDGKLPASVPTVNPRSSPSDPYPKWYYDDQPSTYYTTQTPACGLNGLKQSWHGIGGAPGVVPVCSGASFGTTACIPGYGGVVDVRSKLMDRAANVASSPLATPQYMPATWTPPTPNIWIFNNHLYIEPQANAIGAQLLVQVTGDFAQLIIGSADGTILAFGANDCTATEGTSGGSLIVRTQSKSTTTAAAFLLSITCTGSMSTNSQPTEITMQPDLGTGAPIVTKNFNVACSAGQVGQGGSCTVVLGKINLVGGYDPTDTATTSCKCLAFNTPPPITGGAGPSGTNPPCDLTKSPLNCLGLNLPSFTQYIIIAAICCCCCCCCICCILALVFVLPMLSKGGGGGSPLGAELVRLGLEAHASLPHLIRDAMEQAVERVEPHTRAASELVERTLGRRLFGEPEEPAWRRSSANSDREDGAALDAASDGEMEVGGVRVRVRDVRARRAQALN